MTKWVYLFSEGNANMRELLGGKGANLAEMTSLGLPVRVRALPQVRSYRLRTNRALLKPLAPSSLSGRASK